MRRGRRGRACARWKRRRPKWRRIPRAAPRRRRYYGANSHAGRPTMRASRNWRRRAAQGDPAGGVEAAFARSGGAGEGRAEALGRAGERAGAHGRLCRRADEGNHADGEARRRSEPGRNAPCEAAAEGRQEVGICAASLSCCIDQGVCVNEKRIRGGGRGRGLRGFGGDSGSFIETPGLRDRTDMSGRRRYVLLILNKLSVEERLKTGQVCPV